jgi:ABC-type polysaccharide/polyol phosphate transport system ATPase subunit
VELLKLRGVHFTYPKMSRAAAGATTSGGTGEIEDEAEVDETTDEEDLRSDRRGAYLGEVHALRGIDLTVCAGEGVAILGHPDSGRSTLLEIIAGTLRPTQGRALLRGWATGLIAAGAGFFADATVHDNVVRNGLLMGASKREMQQLAPQIVEFAELTDRANDRLRLISRRESRRLAFAVALHMSPAVFLADDPTLFGSAEVREQTLAKLAQKRGPDRALIVVTNKPDLVRRLADRVVILSQGQVVFDGPTKAGLQEFRRSPGASVEQEDEDE